MVSEYWSKYQPNVNVAQAWKTLKPLMDDPEVFDAMALALEFNNGRTYPPSWFVKDLDFWKGVSQRDPFQIEEAMETYRRGHGLR